MKKIRILLALAMIAARISGAALADGDVEAGAQVNVRSGPGLSYRDLGTIYSGDTLEYLEKSSIDNRGVVWYKVEYKGEPGWVSSKYCELFGEVYVYATDGQSYIRQNPNLNGKALTVMHEGEAAEYLGKTSIDNRGVAWYKVEFDGWTGWVSSKYTTLGEEEIYRSENIAPGESVEEIVLSAPLAAGSYDAVAVTTVCDAEGNVQFTSRVPVVLEVAE